MRVLLTSVAVIVGLMGSGASSAFAAKGVKKNPVNGVHHVHGVVTHVQHHKGKNAAGHLGEITIKATHHKKKGKPAGANGEKVAPGNGQNNGQKKNAGHTHKFSVGAGTKFTVVNGKQHQPSNFGAVHPGEHVTILAQGNHADGVAIHTHSVKKGKKAKKGKVKV